DAGAGVAAAALGARPLCEQFGGSPEVFLAPDGIWTFHVIRRELRVARSIAERLLGIAARTGDPGQLVEAHLAAGVPLIPGRLADGCPELEEVVALYDPARHSGHAFVYGQDPLVVALSYLGWAFMLQAREQEALASLARA